MMDAMNCAIHGFDIVSGRCVHCLKRVQPSLTERLDALEQANAKLTERVAKLEAAARRTLL